MEKKQYHEREVRKGRKTGDDNSEIIRQAKTGDTKKERKKGYIEKPEEEEEEEDKRQGQRRNTKQGNQEVDKTKEDKERT